MPNYTISASATKITPGETVTLTVHKDGKYLSTRERNGLSFEWVPNEGSFKSPLKEETEWSPPEKGGTYKINVEIRKRNKAGRNTVPIDGIQITVAEVSLEDRPFTSTEFKDRVENTMNAVDKGMATLAEGSFRNERSTPPLSPDKILWSIIRNRTDAISFKNYKAFMDKVMCQDLPQNTNLDTYTIRPEMALRYRGTEAYQVLKHATEAFLMHETGEFDPEARERNLAGPNKERTGGEQSLHHFGSINADGFDDNNTFFKDGIKEEKRRLPRLSKLSDGDARDRMKKNRDDYLEKLSDEYTTLPYFNRIKENLGVLPLKEPGVGNDSCYGLLRSRVTSPVFLELIFNFWIENSGQCQSLKAINLRFQNRQGPSKNGRNPLSNFTLDPLRPLNNILWGYLGEEMNRLTVVRRAYEYDHQYGISLSGKAIPKLESADSRSKFLAAFHNLLYLCSVFYRDVANTMQVPDGYPILNSLKEVHLILAEGAHNQCFELAWTSRVEMLIEQWLLARPELKNFLMGRTMVPYQEEWMGAVDQMKTLQGWTNTSVRQFRDLGVFGEKILLTIRYGNWSEIADEAQARQWAEYWRAEIQGYIHAYKAATGVDLASEARDEAMIRLRNTSPSKLLERQLNLKAS